MKALAIERDSILVQDLLGEFPRETVGIIELEANLTVQNGLVGVLQACYLFIQ